MDAFFCKKQSEIALKTRNLVAFIRQNRNEFFSRFTHLNELLFYDKTI